MQTNTSLRPLADLGGGQSGLVTVLVIGCAVANKSMATFYFEAAFATKICKRKFGILLPKRSLLVTVTPLSFFSPRAQCPLVSITDLTKWVHFVRSIANLHKVSMSLLHHKTRLWSRFVYLLSGFPLLSNTPFRRWSWLDELALVS